MRGLQVPADSARLHAQLDKLDEHLRRQGAQIADVLEPGLSEHDIDDAVMDSVGLRLPAEARTWFGWHNGTRRLTLADGCPGAAYLPTGFTVLSLAQAIDDCRSRRTIARDQESDGVFTAAEWWARPGSRSRPEPTRHR